MNTVDELIRIYAKQLKIPSFAEYREILRQAEPSSGFPDLLLELIKTETLSRQENPVSYTHLTLPTTERV